MLKEKEITRNTLQMLEPHTKENVPSRPSVIMEVEQNQEHNMIIVNNHTYIYKLENFQMRACSDGKVSIDGAPPPETEPSEFHLEGDTNDERKFTEVKRRRSSRSKQCLPTPDQRTGITMKMEPQVLPQEGDRL